MIELNRENWEEEVIKAEGWVLVDFWSPKCEPCMALKPELEKLVDVYGDKIKFTALDITGARRLAIQEKVLGLPVVAFYRGGKKEHDLTGDITAAEVENKIKEILG